MYFIIRMALVPGGVRLAVLSVSRFKLENPVEHLTADADVGKKWRTGMLSLWGRDRKIKLAYLNKMMYIYKK